MSSPFEQLFDISPFPLQSQSTQCRHIAGEVRGVPGGVAKAVRARLQDAETDPLANVLCRYVEMASVATS